ncbi:MerR family transcriptional regulator [Streptomyces sp. NBC_00257]|uniref:MerR family transcriptional regulator n=1 Tax=Streptomyces TaxID=1883 RepID=UPI0022541CB7|nr:MULTISPECIES: MerR family transcriptional regulator [unclassified Streptomyces]MCX4398747.1 MerR family transcriptional regulator [Streptomyces sp. NBC_01767]MCX4870936.1 MerR family transcriptional regulator [Streptomyces sp. NBC_00906]MCX4901676.1 MerR family transcriptional regulator [Streptomyces sp. NBC_00892]MCX5426919.1 MerR family transcriptional regulator [Streptomyces sp. NBC_00062]WSP52220.1 MerR family transcriptional regulator [Streptomyces sp. NBC_01243]
MRIGEIAARTDTPVRLLRYYEKQGLIEPERLANGYRDYHEHLVDRVQQIRGLLAVGIPTRLIRSILPCLNEPQSIHMPYITPDMAETLERERDKMTDKIRCLTRNRDAITGYLAAIDRCPDESP